MGGKYDAKQKVLLLSKWWISTVLSWHEITGLKTNKNFQGFHLFALFCCPTNPFTLQQNTQYQSRELKKIRWVLAGSTSCEEFLQMSEAVMYSRSYNVIMNGKISLQWIWHLANSLWSKQRESRHCLVTQHQDCVDATGPSARWRTKEICTMSSLSYWPDNVLVTDSYIGFLTFLPPQPLLLWDSMSSLLWS